MLRLEDTARVSIECPTGKLSEKRMKCSCFYIRLSDCFLDILFNEKWQHNELIARICCDVWEAEDNLHRTNIIKMYLNWRIAYSIQGRIQEFILGGAKPRSPIESWGRSPNRGREAPEYRGRSPSRGREAPENWGRSPNRGRSPRKSGGGVWGGGSVSPSPENFWKIKLETIHFGAYLRQLFEMTNKMV